MNSRIRVLASSVFALGATALQAHATTTLTVSSKQQTRIPTLSSAILSFLNSNASCQSQVQSLTASLAAAQATITSQNTAIASLQAQIAALQNTGPSGQVQPLACDGGYCIGGQVMQLNSKPGGCITYFAAIGNIDNVFSNGSMSVTFNEAFENNTFTLATYYEGVDQNQNDPNCGDFIWSWSDDSCYNLNPTNTLTISVTSASLVPQVSCSLGISQGQTLAFGGTTAKVVSIFANSTAQLAILNVADDGTQIVEVSSLPGAGGTCPPSP